MLWSTRKQYYLDFWAFLEFKSANILIKMGLYLRNSVNIIPICYVYENRRKWLYTRTCENIAGKFEIQFYFIFLFWWSIYTYKLLKVFSPKHLSRIHQASGLLFFFLKHSRWLEFIHNIVTTSVSIFTTLVGNQTKCFVLYAMVDDRWNDIALGIWHALCMSWLMIDEMI